jgi:peptide/nickel transport system substrate-binding protein
MKNLFFITLGILISIITLFSACKTATSTSTTKPASTTTSAVTSTTSSTTKTVSSTTTAVTMTQSTTTGKANWWDKFGIPQYGGTFTQWNTVTFTNFDPSSWVEGGNWYWCEPLFMNDWKLDRSIFGFNTGWVPTDFWTGLLAQNWSFSDPQTLVVTLRKGITWQNKPPVNGREFTAYDVQYHFDRMLGTGNGFTKPAPMYASWISAYQQIIASDKYTFTIKFKATAQFSNLGAVLEPLTQLFEAPEWVAQGDTQNWKNAVGTGPFIITDYVSGSSVTYSKNPSYWNNDERYPQNKLPYLDKIVVLTIPDKATARAGLRSGQLDRLDNISLADSQALLKTNPELQYITIPAQGLTVQLRVDKAPFNDINVRKALQMSIDLKTFAKSLGGASDGTPCGVISPSFKGFTYAYNDWPQSLKDEYSYNVSAARQLLTQAGYPNGLQTTCDSSVLYEVGLLQVLQSYFKDVNVNMTINTMDHNSWLAMARGRLVNQMSVFKSTGSDGSPPAIAIGNFTSTFSTNITQNNDSTYDQLANKINASNSLDEAKQTAQAADRRMLEQHWLLQTFPMNYINMWQQWVKGYSGEFQTWQIGQTWARIWIDKSLKK